MNFVNVCMVMKDRPLRTAAAFITMVSTTYVPMEIVINDDKSDKPFNEEQRRTLGGFHRFSMNDSVKNRGVGGSKNRAVEVCQSEHGRGDYLYLSDNDVIFTPGWLETLIAALEEHPRVKIVGGYAHPYNGTNQTLRGNVNVDTKNAVDGLSWLMRWETWDKYGTLMDNARGVRQSEDWEYCQRIRNDGYEVGVVYPHVVINNGIVDTFGEKIPDWERVLANHGR